jgi:hypothetical protein
VTNSLVRTLYRNVWQVIFIQTFCKQTASTLKERSSTNTTSDVLTTWRSDASFQSGCQAVSESQIPKPMDWSWRWTQNWPPRSADLNPLDYHVWGYMKAMVYAHKVNTRKELLQRILSAARSINKPAVLRKVTSFVVTRARKCIQANGGHFEQLVWVLNSESVVVHLTTHLN